MPGHCFQGATTAPGTKSTHSRAASVCTPTSTASPACTQRQTIRGETSPAKPAYSGRGCMRKAPSSLWRMPELRLTITASSMLGTQQLQRGHGGHKRRLALAGDVHVAGLFFAKAGMAVVLVVMAGSDGGGLGQREQHAGDAVAERAGASGLKVGSAAAVDQQGVAGEHRIAPDEAHAAGGVALARARPAASRRQNAACAIARLHTSGGGARCRNPTALRFRRSRAQPMGQRW